MKISYKITKQIVGEVTKKIVYDGMYLSEAQETLKNKKRLTTGEVVIDTPNQLTIVTAEYPLGISYRVEQE